MNIIYALIDRELLTRYDIPLERLLDFLNTHAIPIAQYRDKHSSDTEVAQALETIRSRYRGTLIVNDRLALTPLADGLHLGQEDLAALDSDPAAAVAKVREAIGEKLLGLSTHDAEEIAAANTLDLDYIGLGAYRPTTTKADAVTRGEALLAIARASRHPVAIIGGVRWEDEFPEPIRYKVLGSALFERMAAS